MPLRPHDVKHKQFRRVLRGFDEQEVFDYLSEVARKMQQLMKDNASLRDKVEEYAGRMEQYNRMEEVLQDALLVAQEAAAEVKNNALEEAKLIRQEAQQEAQAIRRAAQQEVAQAEASYNSLLERSRALRAQMRGHLLSHLEVLDQEDRSLGAEPTFLAAVEAAAANEKTMSLPAENVEADDEGPDDPAAAASKVTPGSGSD